MKTTSYSNTSANLAKTFTKGLEALLEGIHLLTTNTTTQMINTASTGTSTTPTSCYSRITERFTQADTHFAALLLSSKTEFHYDGTTLARFFRELLVSQHVPYGFALLVYEDDKANQVDYDQAYEMYQAYALSIAHLKDILDKIISDKIEVKWLPGTEIPKDKLPNLSIPQPLNHKYVT